MESLGKIQEREEMHQQHLQNIEQRKLNGSYEQSLSFRASHETKDHYKVVFQDPKIGAAEKELLVGENSSSFMGGGERRTIHGSAENTMEQ